VVSALSPSVVITTSLVFDLLPQYEVSGGPKRPTVEVLRFQKSLQSLLTPSLVRLGVLNWSTPFSIMLHPFYTSTFSLCAAAHPYKSVLSITWFLCGTGEANMLTCICCVSQKHSASLPSLGEKEIKKL
jgi:hypothetical protein